MANRSTKIEEAFKKCKKTEDYIKFAVQHGAKVRHKTHWVINHPNGQRTIMSSTPPKKSGLDKTRKEFGIAYDLEHLIHF